MVAYFDKDSWEIADKIVAKMDQGRVQGKRTATMVTFQLAQKKRETASISSQEFN